jgi:restriction endonuclease S subunit
MSRAMKDSGIAFIGETPMNWNICKLDYVCQRITDFVASGSFADLKNNVTYRDDPDYAMLIRATDISNKNRSIKPVFINKESYDFLKNSNLFGGEIMLPNIGGVGEVYIVPKLYDNMSLAPNSIIITTLFCDKYYYYFFCTCGKEMLISLCNNTAQSKFNKTQLRSISTIKPTMEEQYAIANFLDNKCEKIDRLIALQEEMIEELKAYKQSVITEAVTKGLDPTVPMKDSGIEWIGEIPESWRIIKIKFIAVIKNEKATEILPYIGLENIESFSSKYISTDSQYDISQAIKICRGNVLFGKLRPYLAKVYIVIKDSCCSSEFMVFSPSCNSNLLRYVLLSHWFINIVDSSTYGAKMPRANPDYIKNMQIVLPTNNNEQQAIADYLDKKCADIDSLISIKQSKIDELKEYKKSLIYEYVTGKKEVG